MISSPTSRPPPIGADPRMFRKGAGATELAPHGGTPSPQGPHANWKPRRCQILAPPERQPVDCCCSRLPLNPQAEALGLSISEVLTAPHEKVVPLPHWDVVLVEHPALLDAAGAGWGRWLGTRGEEQDGCHEGGARHCASSLAGCGESDWVGRDASDGRRAEQGEGSPFPVRTGSVSHG